MQQCRQSVGVTFVVSGLNIRQKQQKGGEFYLGPQLQRFQSVVVGKAMAAGGGEPREHQESGLGYLLNRLSPRDLLLQLNLKVPQPLQAAPPTGKQMLRTCMSLYEHFKSKPLQR